jgi:WD repeat-containing protein 24
MGQRGLLDRLPVAHTGPILALDWCNSPIVHGTGDGGSGPGNGMGWLASGGLDRCVKVLPSPFPLSPFSPISHVLSQTGLGSNSPKPT